MKDWPVFPKNGPREAVLYAGQQHLLIFMQHWRQKLNLYAKYFNTLKPQTDFPAEIVPDLMVFRSILKP